MIRPALLLTLLAAPASAAETAWQEVAPDTRVRLVSSDVLGADDTTFVGLEIDMPAGTNTYWRIPGETGIPTEIDAAGSTGVAGHRIHWPYPRVEVASGFLDFVYRGPTLLPVELTVTGSGARLEAAILMGVCSDICVPVQAEFTLPLGFDRPDTANVIRLEQALALVPLPWDGPVEAIAGVWLEPAGTAIGVRVKEGAIDPASVIADMGPGRVLFGAPQKSPEAGVVHLPLLGGEDPARLAGQPVTLTFMTPMGAYETTRRISPHPSSASAAQ